MPFKSRDPQASSFIDSSVFIVLIGIYWYQYADFSTSFQHKSFKVTLRGFFSVSVSIHVFKCTSKMCIKIVQWKPTCWRVTGVHFMPPQTDNLSRTGWLDLLSTTRFTTWLWSTAARAARQRIILMEETSVSFQVSSFRCRLANQAHVQHLLVQKTKYKESNPTRARLPARCFSNDWLLSVRVFQLCLCILITTQDLSTSNTIILAVGVVWACLTAAVGAVAVRP